MPISKSEFLLEEKRLAYVTDIIRKHISSLGSELISSEEKQQEFKKFIWDSHTEMDPSELATIMSDNDVEVSILMSKGIYLQKLYRIQNKPYFGRIIFDSEEDGIQDIYIGISYVSAIRRGIKKEVIKRDNINNEIDSLVNDINDLKKEYKSVAVITKTDKETNYLY